MHLFQYLWNKDLSVFYLIFLGKLQTMRIEDIEAKFPGLFYFKFQEEAKQVSV